MRRLCLFASVLAACSAEPGATTDSGTGTSGSSGMAEGTGSTGGSSGAEPTSVGPTTVDPTTDPTTGPGETGATTAVGDDTSGTAATAETGGSSTGEPVGGGCGRDPGPDGEQTVTVQGAERKYIVSLPADYDSSKQYPLVFAWHGRGGDGALAKLYFKVEEASAGAAVFVYPFGLPLADMQNQTGWDLDPANEDFEFFDTMLADLGERLCIDPARVFSTGHSFGGYMSNQIGCFRGGTVRAIGLVAGGGPYVPPCVGNVAAWIAHGTLDAVVPYTEGTDSHAYWSGANNCAGPGDAVDPEPCVADDGCDADYPVVWCSHDEPAFDGHGWPSWAGAGIWGFFAQF